MKKKRKKKKRNEYEMKIEEEEKEIQFDNNNELINVEFTFSNIVEKFISKEIQIEFNEHL